MLLQRFYDKIDWGAVAAGTSCWPWKGSVVGGSGLKYGVIRVKGVLMLAHRVSYSLFNGELKEDLVVMHACDNPHCVKPTHLSLGTLQENRLDCVNKGRSAAREINSSAKLSDADVEEIKALADMYTPQQLADMYCVTRSTIYNLVKNVDVLL